MELVASCCPQTQASQAATSTSSRARITDRLWKDRSQWRKSQVSANEISFLHRALRRLQTKPRALHSSHEPIRIGNWDNLSWGMSRLEKTEEPCAIEGKPQEAMNRHNNNDNDNDNRSRCGWVQMRSLEEILVALEAGVQPQPSVEDFVCILHKCRKEKNRGYALRLHAYMRKSGVDAHKSLGNYLVPILVEVGSMCDAQNVFGRLEYRNEISWTSLITGYVKCGKPHDALILYHNMQEDDSVHPNGYTFVAVLKACTNLKDLGRGREIHSEIARRGLLEKDLFVGNTLVDMYAKIGSLAKAHEVFDHLPVRDVVSWNALIAGYAEHGHGDEALHCFEEMQIQGISPNIVTCVCCLRACGAIGATEKGQQIHAEIARKGLQERDPFVGNTLVDMYAKCGFLAKAQEVFDKLPVRDVVSWTALISGYTEHGHGKEALDCFKQMQYERVSPDAVTFLCILKACGSIGATEKGREIHVEIAKKGLVERDHLVSNALVNMYAKCGSLVESQQVFDKLLVRDIVSWNALLAGYAEHGHSEDALNCFEQMQLEGVSPNAVTLVCILKACISIGAIDKCRALHAEIARKGFLEKDLPVGNALVDVYAKCGLLAEATEVFDKLPVRDVVSWNVLIGGYAESGHDEEAFSYFEQMQIQGISPDTVTFVCILKACGSMGATDKGNELHAEIAKKGLLERDLVGKALVDMYVKCGSFAKAQEVFDRLPFRDVVLWTALIAGYAQLGDSEIVFTLFDRMIGDGIKPNVVTFFSVLNACCHAGLVDKGETYFQAMSRDHGILPTLEHHTCMVDLLGRAGQLDQAVAIIKEMPFYPDLAVWHIMLGACQKWGNVELGRLAFEHAVQLDEKDAIAYVCMYNIYADADMQEDANKVEAMRMEKQAWNKPGHSHWNYGFIFDWRERTFLKQNIYIQSYSKSFSIAKMGGC